MRVIVPVMANGVRAFGTIFVAQYRGAQVAAGFGWHTRRVGAEAELADAFAEALASSKPALIDVAINPDPYDAMIEAIRG